MTMHEHVLQGFAPVPLAGYLKALGVFRLVAEQADGDARGFWRDERFVMQTRLTQEALVDFFVHQYRPTPIVAPWNGGSGFWPKDNRDGLAAIQGSSDARLSSYRAAIGLCQELIRDTGLSEAPKEAAKASLIVALRSSLSDEACRWLDGALALTTDGPRYPPILGTGGNDGRLDFSNNFMRRLTQTIADGVQQSADWLRSSLFSELSGQIPKGAVGQFAPGAAGGVNAGIGFESGAYVNPWDFVLTVEGGLIFAAAAVRRHAQDQTTALAFPFTTRTVGAGSGAAALADEADARAEFWAPLWSRATGRDELLLLMSEGRAVLNGNAARDGLDFARAAAQLGVARGIQSFQRHGFLMRAGKAYFATPIGRIRAQDNSRASLMSELDARGWLARVRGALRDPNLPSSLAALGRRLDEALFRLAGDGSGEAVQEALVVIGAIAVEAGRRPKLRKTDKGLPPVPPPPRLSAAWAEAAMDGSHEFALAEALASLDAATDGFHLPFRCHVAPLDTTAAQDSWDEMTGAKALAVWVGRGLVRDMVTVLERRLIEAQRHDFGTRGTTELPLHGRRPAPLSSIAAFLAGRTDDRRLAALAAGLAWARPGTTTLSVGEREDALPFAYAALKPLFSADGLESEAEQKHLPDPLPLLRQIRAGRMRDAVALAQRIARGAGLPVLFRQIDAAVPFDHHRLAAALLFPVSRASCRRLTARGYPDMTKDEEKPDAA